MHDLTGNKRARNHRTEKEQKSRERESTTVSGMDKRNKTGSVYTTLRHDGIMLYNLGHPTSQIPYHSKRDFLWLFNVAGNNKWKFFHWKPY